MSIQGCLLNGAISAIETFHPELTPILSAIMKYEPELERLEPVILAAVKEGPGAFAAAEEHAPELAAAIRHFVASKPGTAPSPAASAAQVATASENFTRKMFGLNLMNPDEERAWMDGTTPNVGNSQAGSG